MATFRKRNDKWQARVQRSGQSPIAKSFNTKADAIKWARTSLLKLMRAKRQVVEIAGRIESTLAEFKITPTDIGQLKVG